MNFQHYYRRKQARDEADAFIAEVFTRGAEDATRAPSRLAFGLALAAAATFAIWVAQKSGALSVWLP